MLDQYNFLRQEKEQERQRQRVRTLLCWQSHTTKYGVCFEKNILIHDLNFSTFQEQKRLQGQLIAEQEALFGSKPSPSKSGKKLSRISTIGAANRRFSHGGMMLQAPNPEKAALHSCPTKKDGCVKQNNSLKHQQYNGSAVLSSGKFFFCFLKKLNWLVSVTLLNEETMTTHSSTKYDGFTSLCSCILCLFLQVFVCVFVRNNWHRTSVLEPCINHPYWVLITIMDPLEYVAYFGDCF